MYLNHRMEQVIIKGFAWAGMVSIVILASCSPSNTKATDLPQPGQEASLPTVNVPTAESVVEVSPPQEERPLSGLNADPQRIEFQTEDGFSLVGYFYPSKYANAPVIILMHWGGGDLCDWSEVAPWLQNRTDENPAKIDRCKGGSDTWWDPTWFPKMNPASSLAVFAFDFRGFGESGKNTGAWEDMKLDALAAFETAAGFEGVDATRMAAMGASFGADGAPDGCLLYNQKAGSGCAGALSLSPGNYLGMNYAVTVSDLALTPVWCFASADDRESAPTCESASGEAYRTQIYAGNNHGMLLLQPNLEPQPMILIQEFLELVFEEPVKE